MAVSPGVLVTRPAGQAGALLAGVEAAGCRGVHQPMLVLAPVDRLSPAQRQILLGLDRYRHIIFISANAVRFGMARIDDYWPQLPVDINWYAIGASTAELLGERGLSPLCPGEQMNSEGLLARPELLEVDGERVLIVKGRGGRSTLRRVLGERGAAVDELACYLRTPPALPGGALAALLVAERIDVALISSGEGLANMLTLLRGGESTKFNSICLIVPSPRVASLARRAGFSEVRTAANASDAAMLEALKQWRGGE